ncbi:COQ9 [Abeliophyllum distichum]|uniref:Ubiquinone biosynthesis protein n=1 Tax=Abeliophyllum distichum TaxID=126358 RepID=A0ABD1V7Z0_9LAMI
MYRLAAKRLLPAVGRWNPRFRCSSSGVRALAGVINPLRFYTSASSGTIPDQNPDNFDASASSSSTAWSQEERSRADDETQRSRNTTRPRAHWQDEQARVLQASLRHVIRLGWTDAAMIAGARDVGMSPSIVGSFPRKEAALVEFFMDDCLQRLIDIIDTKDDFKNLIPSHRVSKLVKIRLEMQAPYISKWPQALSVQAQPLNIPTSFKQRAMLVDEIWHAADDEAADIDWYVKRTVLGGIYSTAELYMLTDTSPDFQDTWAFLDERIRDAFDLKKTVQEAKYLAEAVGAGIGGSLPGFMKSVFNS